MRAVFLDRDGVINRGAAAGEYITEADDFQLLPGVADAIAELEQAGFLVIVVTNQRAIARGHLTEDGLAAIHSRMQRLLAAAGASLAGIYYCPHEGGCECRKPKPGMLLRAAQDHKLNLADSWMVGDSDTDVAAGQSAGCRTLRICDKPTGANASSGSLVGSLGEAVHVILRQPGARSEQANPARRAPSP